MDVIILFNPKSTGGSKENAYQLAKELRQKGITVEVQKTKYPGHGEEVARDIARSGRRCILISSSGDGGYHEVVNGALTHPKSPLVVGVLPSGNANDHFSALGSDSLTQAIARNRFKRIDTIRVSGTKDGKPWVRYAHSYVGLGVTATAAKRLTEERPNAITEKWIVLHALFTFRSVKLKEHGKVRRYSSVLFGNINRMSKVIKLSEGASVTDGKFDMSAIRFKSRFSLLLYLATAATIGFKDAVQKSKYSCVTVKALPIQLDGEAFLLDAGTKLTVESVHKNLHCVL